MTSMSPDRRTRVTPPRLQANSQERTALSPARVAVTLKATCRYISEQFQRTKICTRWCQAQLLAAIATYLLIWHLPELFLRQATKSPINAVCSPSDRQCPRPRPCAVRG